MMSCIESPFYYELLPPFQIDKALNIGMVSLRKYYVWWTRFSRCHIITLTGVCTLLNRPLHIVVG